MASIDQIGEVSGKQLFTDATLVFCERFDETSDIWNLEKHQHPFLEVMYFLDGGATVSSKDGVIALSVFDIILYPENYPHHEAIDLTRSQEVICLGFQIPSSSKLKKIYRLTDFDGSLRWLFIQLQKKSKENHPASKQITRHLVQLVLLSLNVALESLEHIDDPIQRVLLYIHDNISKQISLGELANLAHYSPSYLIRQFKAHTGCTPIEYVTKVRMESAKKFLENPSLTLNQIATMVGIEDQKYFSKLFLKVFGLSPSHFRKQLCFS